MTGCSIFLRLMKPLRASVDDVMLVLDSMEARLSFLCRSGGEASNFEES